MKSVQLPRLDFITSGAALLVAAGCSGAKNLSPNLITGLSPGQARVLLTKSGVKVEHTPRFPMPRPDGTIPPRHRKPKPMLVEPPCTQDGSCDGGGGSGGPTPDHVFSFGGYDGYGYSAQNYAETYDDTGTLVVQKYLSPPDANGGLPITVVTASGTATATRPPLASMPTDTTITIGNRGMHTDSATGITLITSSSSNSTATATPGANNTIIIAEADSNPGTGQSNQCQPGYCFSVGGSGGQSAQCNLMRQNAFVAEMLTDEFLLMLVFAACIASGGILCGAVIVLAALMAYFDMMYENAVLQAAGC